MHEPTPDPRDAADVDPEAVNSALHYGLTSVFATDEPLPADALERRRLADAAGQACDATGAVTRGWYDVAAFRADADLLVWWLADDPLVLQRAYRALVASSLGTRLRPVWSVMGQHTPAEFNKKHIPACLGGVAPRDWVTVYPFIRSYEWYLLPPEERSRIMAEHGRSGARFPDVKGSTLSAFGMSDYEWILAFEAVSLDRIEAVLHGQRYTEARLHVREDTPFYTGHRVSVRDWVDAQRRRAV